MISLLTLIAVITQKRTLAARGLGEEKTLWQAVGCRFIFPESDFDHSNSIGSGNLSVLTSTLIGLATESS